MRLRSSLKVILLSLSLSFPAQALLAQTPTAAAPIRDAQAITVIQNSMTAMGGQNLSGVANIQETITLTDLENGTSSTAAATITANQSNAFRSDVQDSSGNNLTTIWTEGRAQMQSASGVEELPRSAFGNAGLTHIPLLSVLSHWQDPEIALQYVGLETIGSSSAYHLRLQSPLDPSLGLGAYDLPCDFYIDSQSFFVTRLIYAVRSPADLSKASAITANYGNYTSVSGLMIPFSVNYTSGDNLLVSQTVQSAVVNAPISSSQFQFAVGE
jgi:hypothetical protein